MTRVAGPDPRAERDRVHNRPGERWFAPDRPIRRVHGDASMFVGGLRALLLQSLHPLAMAAVSCALRLSRRSLGSSTTHQLLPGDHDVRRRSRRGGGRRRVKAVHERVRGKSPDGTPYSASDPHLLGGSMWRRWTASWRHTSGTAYSRSTPANGTAMSPTPPGSGVPWGWRIRRSLSRTDRPRCGVPRRTAGSNRGRYMPGCSGASTRATDGPSGVRGPAPRRRSYCCRGGRAGRCGCRTSHWPRPRWSAWPAKASPAPSCRALDLPHPRRASPRPGKHPFPARRVVRRPGDNPVAGPPSAAVAKLCEP